MMICPAWLESTDLKPNFDIFSSQLNSQNFCFLLARKPPDRGMSFDGLLLLISACLPTLAHARAL
jgi:hypothetical protein